MENETNSSDVHMDDIEIPARYPSAEDLELPTFEMAGVESTDDSSLTFAEEEVELESDSIVSDEVLRYGPRLCQWVVNFTLLHPHSHYLDHLLKKISLNPGPGPFQSSHL